MYMFELYNQIYMTEFCLLSIYKNVEFPAFLKNNFSFAVEVIFKI